MRFPQFIAATWLALMIAVVPAHAEKRVALVIGNDRYTNLSPNEQLQKAVNDARAVGTTLKQIGFDVIEGENLGRQAVLARIDDASQRLTAGDTVFFFFSGHGVAVDGFNYILPADVPAVGTGQITSLTGAAIKEEDITAAFLRAGARVAVVVLDACRNNPFAGSGTKGVGGEKGLAPHEPPSGVFTFYAASRGESALDRLYDGDSSPNSVFTRVLVPALSRPDLDLPALAREVREEVTRLARTVNHAQRPAYYDETSGNRIFLAALPPGTGRPGGSASSSALLHMSEPSAATPAAPAAPPQVAIVAPPVIPALPAADPCSGPLTASFPSRCAAPLTAAQERGLKPKDSFRECENCPEMVVVPAGSLAIQKGTYDEGPQRVVTIGKPFAVGMVHVTVDQFAAFVRETRHPASSKCWTFEGHQYEERTGRSWRNPGFVQEGARPVVCLTWEDAKAYVDWLAKRTGRPYRLLSEAEWEYVARGTPETEHHEPDTFGLYNMAGNYLSYEIVGNNLKVGSAWAQTADCYHDTYKSAPSHSSVWETKNCNDVDGAWREGAWKIDSKYLRASWYFRNAEKHVFIGLRLARTLTPPVTPAKPALVPSIAPRPVNGVCGHRCATNDPVKLWWQGSTACWITEGGRGYCEKLVPAFIAPSPYECTQGAGTLDCEPAGTEDPSRQPDVP
jgi:formylglycine-generating enzyme required for sulfatase activity/uncharacterized caspase-like protein